MKAFDSAGGGLSQGLVASLIENYGGRFQAHSTNLYPRGASKMDPSGPHLQNTTKSSGPSQFLAPLGLWEPEPEKWHGPPHSPKVKDSAHELQRRLHIFSMFGIPRLPPEDRQHWEIGEGDWSNLTIERSWKELVPGHKEMSQDLCHQQEALWELLTTELVYVRKLMIITDLLVNGLLNLQRVGLLTDVSAESLFGNVPSLIRVHQSFWEEVLGPTLEETRASGQPLDPISLQDGFLTFRQRFEPYVKYCIEVKQTMAHARQLQDSNHLFHAFVQQWCEKHKRAGRQQLGDLLIKPHQRITKYPLLLRAVLKRSPEARAQKALSHMLKVVESFLGYINTQVRHDEEQKSLAAAAQRIGPYEVLEPSNEEVEKRLRHFSTLNLMTPIMGVASEHTRQLLHEGPARVKEGREGKLDVYLFLFSDVLLVTKPQRKAKAKVIRAPLILEKLVCQPLRDPNSFLVIHLTEFFCASSAFTVHCSSAADRARWLEKTRQAQVTLQKLKSEEYIQQKRALLALYSDSGQEFPGTRPSTPSPVSLEGSQSSTEGRTPEFSDLVIPHLVVTEDTEEEAPSVPDDTSDSGYGTLVSDSPKGSRSPLSRLRQRALRRDPRLTSSTLDLRDVPLRLQPPNPQALQRRSAPELPEEGIRQGGSLPRRPPPAWSEEEDRTPGGDYVASESLHRALLRGQVPLSPAHTDSAGESPWEYSGDEEEERSFPGHHHRNEDALREGRLREIRKDLDCQRIEGSPEPRASRPPKLTRAQLYRMRENHHVIKLDSTLSTS
ncbi:Pleckstrin homology domain-containing family G member 6 [Galemys pyrenaicus]|uniref:Pleckstrin homology domain-containing family G member 6 n=1 Tax=Galemys pyrenaicus TaxID=202257 RepID=A0A8J6DGZ9_GALPY|nr:Pleckstrin homology domain-containing family G member 6 [Galemys pyrenaicus]